MGNYAWLFYWTDKKELNEYNYCGGGSRSDGDGSESESTVMLPAPQHDVS